MRKYLLIITLALAAHVAATAQPVSKTVAAAKAASFLHLKGEAQLQLLNSPYETLYLFAIDGGGFVIVSAEGRVQPILGYSLQSTLDVDNLPSNFSAWLKEYDMQIRAAMADASLPTHAGWVEQPAPKSGVEGYDSIVGPLLTTTWSQSPLYNNLCPLDDGDLTLTGCIATAMAQLMKYWNWPATGVGQHSYSTYNYGTLSADFGATTYDWANMPNALSSSSSPTQVTAVATLMYHCGVAVDMNYSTTGSGISNSIMFTGGLNLPCPENALRTYFKYSPDLRGVRRIDFTNEGWAALIKNEIDHRRPVLYEGLGSAAGHEFVCDGYDTSGYFHFNWGWNGDADGYFTFSSLNPLGYDFTNSQTAIIAIEPDTLYGSLGTCTVTVTSADTTKGTVNGGGVFNYRDTVLLYARAASGYRFLQWSNGSSVNPYPLLAHDISLTAYFTQALAEDGDIISYCGENTSNISPYTARLSTRIGIKLPASALAGHKYLSAIDFFHYMSDIVIYVHRGGDDAPGPVVYTQPAHIDYGNPRWNRITFETPIPIDTCNNLWVTMRFLKTTALQGIPNLGASDGNWMSSDNGASWTHLNETQPNSSVDDTSIYWLIRCITSPDSATNTNIAPLAFLVAPDQGNIGDTLMVELLKSTPSSVVWDFDNADYANVVNDSLYIVWNTAGHHSVTANIVGLYGTSNINATMLIADCGSPISTFPYILNYNQSDEFIRVCWQFLHYGEYSGYYLNSGHISLLVSDNIDEWYVSPLIDLDSDQPMWLEIEHSTPENGNITVELSQGGTDTNDFTTIYTLEPSGELITTPPISLSEHYQGHLIRIAVRMRALPGTGTSRFDITKLRIWKDNVGIAPAGPTTLAVSPNPARQTALVTLPDPDGILTLFDASGRQIMQRHTSSTQTAVNVNSLPQGVYLLQYTSPRGTTTTRFVVQ